MCKVPEGFYSGCWREKSTVLPNSKPFKSQRWWEGQRTIHGYSNDILIIGFNAHFTEKKNMPGTGNLINNTWLETLQTLSVEPTTFIL